MRLEDLCETLARVSPWVLFFDVTASSQILLKCQMSKLKHWLQFSINFRVSGSFSGLRAADYNATPFQFLDYFLGVEKDDTVIAGFDFLFNACLGESTERHKIASNGSGS